VSSFHSGNRVRLLINIVNQGSADDVYTIDCRGPAAVWHEKAAPIPLKAGKENVTGVDFTIPSHAPMGTYRVEVVVRSRAHPDVRATESMLIALLPVRCQ
jgi:uncharacterized membrane protein